MSKNFTCPIKVLNMIQTANILIFVTHTTSVSFWFKCENYILKNEFEWNICLILEKEIVIENKSSQCKIYVHLGFLKKWCGPPLTQREKRWGEWEAIIQERKMINYWCNNSWQ